MSKTYEIVLVKDEPEPQSEIKTGPMTVGAEQVGKVRVEFCTCAKK